MQGTKEHNITCTECRQYTREMLNEDRDAISSTFRQIIREEWQTSIQIKERVKRLEKSLSWVIIIQGVNILLFAFIIYENLIK